MIFDKQWFNRHQSKLIWLLNNFFTKRWFRYCMRINTKEPINRIEPNSYIKNAKRKGKEIECTQVFRTHEKYGKRLYYAFKPLWYLFHFWDWLSRFEPRLNLGFDTLTVYPDAGTGSTTVDGYVERGVVGTEDWSTKRDAASGTNTDATSTGISVLILADNTTDNYDRIRRIIMTYDTSSLGSGATISAAQISLYGVFKLNTLSGQDSLDICESTPASNNDLVVGDYNQLGTTSFGTLTYASMSTTAYNDITLNSSGEANISKTGISKFGGRVQADLTDTEPTWSSSDQILLAFLSADQTGTSQDPKLVITYTGVASDFIPQITIL